MQVTVENLGALERRMRIEVPEEEIAGEVQNRLKSLSRSTRIDGFRPGKVPMSLIERRFGRQVRQEVVGEVMRNTFIEAVSEQNLRPAGVPQLEPVESEPGKGMVYDATFEVYPEIELAELEGLELRRPVCDVDDEAVDRMIENLRKQSATWEVVERPAQMGDQVTIDFKGTIDGEPFQGGEAEGLELELGSGTLIEGFEAGLEGASAGDEVSLDLRFPDDYPREELAGKPVQFKVMVKQVAEPKLPDLDEEFFARYDVKEGGLEAFREEVRANMLRESEQSLRAHLKQRVMDALLSANTFDIPRALIEQEANRLLQETRQNLVTRGLPEEATEGLQPEMFEGRARRRVAMGLLVAEIIRREKLRAQPDEVRKMLEKLASAYDQPEQVIAWYQQDPQRMAEIENMILEDKAIDLVVEKARVTDEPMSFEEALRPADIEDEDEEEEAK